MRTFTGPVAMAFVWACGTASSNLHTVSIPSPCVGNDTVYASDRPDPARDFHPASPRATVLPPQTFRGRAVVLMLVSATGRVVGDSTRVTGVPLREDSLSLARSVAGDQFLPARLGTCAVASWFSLQVTRR